MGKEVQPFPILQELGMKGSPTLMKMRDNEHYHVLSMAASGHLYITDAVDACTEVVDIGLGAGLYLFSFLLISLFIYVCFP